MIIGKSLWGSQNQKQLKPVEDDCKPVEEIVKSFINTIFTMITSKSDNFVLF